MNGRIYTPNPVPVGLRAYSVDVAAVVRPGLVWRYSGCEHHIREMIAAQREAGDDTTVYHLFHTSILYCGACHRLDTGEFSSQPESLWLSNQIAMATLAPGPVGPGGYYEDPRIGRVRELASQLVEDADTGEYRGGSYAAGVLKDVSRRIRQIVRSDS